MSPTSGTFLVPSKSQCTHCIVSLPPSPLRSTHYLGTLFKLPQAPKTKANRATDGRRAPPRDRQPGLDFVRPWCRSSPPTCKYSTLYSTSLWPVLALRGAVVTGPWSPFAVQAPTSAVERRKPIPLPDASSHPPPGSIQWGHHHSATHSHTPPGPPAAGAPANLVAPTAA